MSKAKESIDDMGKFNEKIYEDVITWLLGHHCLECRHLTLAQHEVKELVGYFYKLSYHQAEKDLELTWEDISMLRQIMFDYNRQVRDEMSIPNDMNYCKEVLKRFKERNKL